MIICLCNSVTVEDIKDLVKVHNCKTIENLQAHTDVCDTCELCKERIEEVLNESPK